MGSPSGSWADAENTRVCVTFAGFGATAATASITGKKSSSTTGIDFVVDCCPSETVNVAVKLPAAPYVCWTSGPVAGGVLSPKSHEYVTGNPSGSWATAVKATG